MNSLFSVLQYGLAILEVYICYCFYKLLEPDRFKKNANSYIWCWSFAIGMLLTYNRNIGPLLSWTMLILQSILIIISLFKKMSGSRILGAGIIIVTNIYIALLQLLVTFVMVTVIPDMEVKDIYFEPGKYRTICYCVTLIMVYIIYLGIAKYRKQKSNTLESFKWVFVIYAIAGILAIIAFQRELIIYGKERSLSNSFSLIILIMATVSILIGNIKGAEIKNEIQMIEIRNKMLGESYQEIKDIFHNHACTYHDMKNYLLVIEDFCKSGESDRAIQFIEEIRKPLNQSKKYIHTGNETMDIILSYKLAEAEKIGIHTEVDVDQLDKIKVEESDLCSVFSNLIDNAIEACELMENENRWIRIIVKNKNDMLVIKLENSYSKKIRGAGKDFQTWKKGEHGYGMKSVKRKVEKYGGEVEWNYGEEKFITMVTFFDAI